MLTTRQRIERATESGIDSFRGGSPGPSKGTTFTEKHQGREFTATVQAPDRGELDNLLGQLSRFAKGQGLERIRIVDMHPDPDGGWEAIMKAHNWNPTGWLKGKFGVGKTPKVLTQLEEEELARQQAEGLEGEGLPRGATQDVYEELEELRREKATAEDTTRKWEEKEKQRASAEAAKEYAAKQRGEYKEPTEEELLSKLSPRDRKKYERMIQEGREEEAKARLEALKAGVRPTSETQYAKMWQPGYWSDPATGKAVKEGTPGAEYRPGEYRFVQMPTAGLTPAELRYKTYIQTEQLEQAKATRRSRKLAPYRKVGEIAGSAAKELIGVTALGIAGVAQAAQPGKGGPQRASRMLAPSLPMEVYAPGRPSMDLSGLRRPGGISGPSPTGGLGHLRSALLPSLKGPQSTTRTPVTSRRIGLPRGEAREPDLSRFKGR